MPIVLKSGSLNLLEPSGPVQACNGIALPLYVLHQHGGFLRLAVTGNRKLHHIYVLDQHSGWAWAVVGNKLLHPIHCRPNAGTSGDGGGLTHTVARDVSVRSQVSSPANEYQMAAALLWNTTQAVDSWLTGVKQQQAALWSHHSYSRHLAALPHCLSIQHKMFRSTTFVLATYSVSTWCMP